MASLPLPLQRLLADLESPYPTIQELPPNLFSSEGGFGDYFRSTKGEEVARWDTQRRAARLRLFTAIGNCRTLRNIDLYQYFKSIDPVVQEEEARALLSGLPSNPVLEHLDLSRWDGFGTVAACVALAHMLRCTRSLQRLWLNKVGMTSEGLGHIAAALEEANCRSPVESLQSLQLGRNAIGDASGAQQLAHILATTRTLEELGIYGMQGMDVAGAEVVANALAHSTTLKGLSIGCVEIRGPNQSAPLSELVMRALSGQWSASQGTPTSTTFNHSITSLSLCVENRAGGGGAWLLLGEAVQQMLASNSTLTSLRLTTNFLRFGLDSSFANNTTISHLYWHGCADEDVELEMLIPILRSSRTLEALDLSRIADSPASFKRALFQSLEHNPSIRTLVLDGWDGLNEDMYRDLMGSLRVNSNLQVISLKDTSWEREGKDAPIAQALQRNTRRGIYRIVMAALPLPLRRLLADLESPSPTIQELPPTLFSSEGGFGDYFRSTKGEEVARWDTQRRAARLRLFTAIGNCRTLRNIDLYQYFKSIDPVVQEEEARALLSGLPSNPVLEHLDLSRWDGFGTVAACVALAHMLRCTRSLQRLWLNKVGMTSEGLGHIAAALEEANCRSPVESLQSLQLGRNAIGDASGAQQLAHILATTRTLEELGIYGMQGMDVAGAEVVANALAHSTTLKGLSIGCVEIRGPNQSAPLSKLVMRALSGQWSASQGTPTSTTFNHSITSLSLCVENRAGGGGAWLLLGEAVQQMLASNSTLTSLRLTTNFLRFGLDSSFANNTTISHLHWHGCADEDVELEMLIPILRSSRTLEALDLSRIADSPASFKRALFQSLEHNPSIRTLVLDGWDSLNEDMYRDLMGSLRVNSNLQVISLKHTSWEREGKDAPIAQALQRNTRRVAYLSLAEHGDVEFTDPQAGRLILCGSAFAGKTTFRKKLVASCQPLSWSQRLKQKLPGWRGTARTEGIEIEELPNDKHMHITIWDLAGQDYFRALQDHLFPTITQACIFFFAFSPYDHQTHKVKQGWRQELEKDLRYWFRFIVSKCSNQGHILPQVYVILTHLDKMIKGTTSDTMENLAKPIINKVGLEFGEVLKIMQVFALDVRSSSKTSLTNVKASIFQQFEELLGKKLDLVPRPCTQMGEVLTQWMSQNPTRPILQMAEFRKLCHKEVKELQMLQEENQKAQDIVEAISCYLHDVGIVMYFKDVEFLVINPNWVTHVFLGQLIKFGQSLHSPPTMMPPCSNGVVTKDMLQTILQTFLSDNKTYEGFNKGDLTHLLLKLELCYEEKVFDSLEFIDYFVPSALDDANGMALNGERQLKWPLRQLGKGSMHVGRRLQCKDQLRTFLGPGFFPRLQVRLRNKLFAKRPGMKNQQYTNQKNLIIIYVDGMEVLVESREDIPDHLDILVRSEKTPEQTTAFLASHIIDEVKSFCASPGGCPGVTLVEAIIRPECVSSLTICTHRQSQVVLKEELISYIVADEKQQKCGELFSTQSSLDYHHTWIPVPEIGLGAESTRAEELLDPGDIWAVVSQKVTKVDEQLTCIGKAARAVLGTTHSNHGKQEITTTGDLHGRSMLDRTMSDIAGPSHPTVFRSLLHHGFHNLGNKLDRMDNKFDRMDDKLDVIMSLQQQTLQKLEDLKALQEETLVTLLSTVDDIMNFSAELVESEMPRMPYFTTKDVSMVQRLVAGVRIGKAVMLHFMCEGTRRNLCHGVEGQPGYELILEDAKWEGIRSIALNSVRVMVFLANAGLHVAAGIGGAIPDVVNWGAAAAVNGTALLGESLLNELNEELAGKSQSRCMEEEWPHFKEMLKKPLEGQVKNLFGLSRARVTRDSKQRVVWVCEECWKRGTREHILVPF